MSTVSDKARKYPVLSGLLEREKNMPGCRMKFDPHSLSEDQFYQSHPQSTPEGICPLRAHTPLDHETSWEATYAAAQWCAGFS